MTQRFALLASIAFLLSGCPTTASCGPAEVWNGTMCVPENGDAGVDGGTDGGTLEPDVPCGGGCTSPEVCDTTTNECVECLGADASSCTDGDNACVGNVCVACDTNDDCDALTSPQCNASNECEPCTGPAACEGRTGTTVCGDGACVECTADSRAACTSGVCLLGTESCAPTGGANALCGECVADAECPAGQLCIAMMYDDPATGAADPVSAGNHCLWRSDASGPGAPGGACSTIRPYVSTVSRTSVDGTTANVCTLALSTCEAHEDFRMVNCMTLDAPGNARCGRDAVADGVCRSTGGPTNLCTVYCGSDTDCRAGFTCDAGFTPGQCRL